MAKKLDPKKMVIQDDYSYISLKDGQTYTMTMKEKLFCDYYLQFKGDGVDAVFEAGYDVKNAKVAAAISYENLRKPHLIAYINDKLEEYGFNDDEVYKQHLFLLNQHADLKSKAKGVEMYYKLKGKFAPEKSINLNIEVEASSEINKLTDELNALHRGPSKPSHGRTSGAVGQEVQDQE